MSHNNTPSYKIDFNAIKKIVENEIQYRKPLERVYEVLTNRIMMWEFGGDDFIVYNAITTHKDFFSKPTGNIQSMTDLHPEGLDALKLKVSEMDRTLKHSRFKQKFFTYVYNRNLPKLLKAHEKLKKSEEDLMMFMTERIENGEPLNIEIDDTINNKSKYSGFGEGGYKSLCDEIKTAYEQRLTIINYFQSQP